MYELNGRYRSESFFLKINDKRFSLSAPIMQYPCHGFITYISSYVIENKKTGLGITCRDLIFSETEHKKGMIEDLYYQNNAITLIYFDENGKRKISVLEKIS
ncbi:MAG TPA: hypothetical protein PLI19_02850 [Erysipelotrichaceae bacterium]|nr:hypothetical protein [Erysipelotrichaceae bacterium]